MLCKSVMKSGAQTTFVADQFLLPPKGTAEELADEKAVMILVVKYHHGHFLDEDFFQQQLMPIFFLLKYVFCFVLVSGIRQGNQTSVVAQAQKAIGPAGYHLCSNVIREKVPFQVCKDKIINIKISTHLAAYEANILQ